MDVKTYRGPNCDSRHYLVRVKIRQPINVTNEGRYKKPIKWDVSKLREPQIRRQYEQEINMRFRSHGGEYDVQSCLLGYTAV
jgi:hypothetical protein